MIIQLNTDKNIEGNERLEEYLNSVISKELSRFTDNITRVEVHLSDENGSKSGVNDKQCTLEARIENKQPIVVSAKGSTLEKAVTASLDKLKTSIEKVYDKIRN